MEEDENANYPDLFTTCHIYILNYHTVPHKYIQILRINFKKNPYCCPDNSSTTNWHGQALHVWSPIWSSLIPLHLSKVRMCENSQVKSTPPQSPPDYSSTPPSPSLVRALPHILLLSHMSCSYQVLSYMYFLTLQ